ncbi:MAG: hypothetical protein ACI4QA_07945 [Candidatus Spyradosoma sp.]
MLVFLVVVRRWDRGEAATFADMFPLERLFFLPWLRAVAASVLSAVPAFLLFVLALASLTAPLFLACARDEAVLEKLENAVAALAEAADELESDEIAETAAEIGLDDSEALRDAFSETQFLDRILTARDEADLSCYAGTAGAAALACALLFFCAACWLQIRLGFAPYFALDAERTNPFAALKNAWLVTQGKFLRIFFIAVCLVLFVLVGAVMTLGIGLLVLLPFAHLAGATLCVKLMKARPDLALPPSRL